MHMKNHHRRHALAIALSTMYALGSPSVQANPTGAQVVAGQAAIAAQGNLLTVTNSAGAIINWRGFSIGAGETTRFIQPSASSAVLNRVVGQDVSQLLGQLQSNGRVFLINPHGIVVGAGARIDTNSFIASTLDIADADFLAGKLRFIDRSGAGSIRNEGLITAGPGGRIALIAPNIENSGIIHAPDGSILLAAGHKLEIASLDLDGIRFEIQAPTDSVLNLGKLLADNGAVHAFAGSLRQSGEIRATRMALDAGGNIVLSASNGVTLTGDSSTLADGARGGTVVIRSSEGTSRVEGLVSASGTAGAGGDIRILGQRVALDGHAQVVASGSAGGGQILVGGDYQGANAEVQNAGRTYVGPGVALHADALAQGDGGRIIVWADENTRFHGALSARGAAQGGNGGFAEVSGKQNLAFAGSADLSAPAGAHGSLLLDPLDILVSLTSGILPTVVDEFADFASNVVTVSPLSLAAVGANVVLQAARDIYVRDAINLTTGGAGITITAGGALFNAGSVINTAGISTTAGAVTLRGNSITGAGGITTHGGAVDLLTTANLNYSGAISSGGGAVTLGSVNSSVNNANVNAGSGTIAVTARSISGGSYTTTGTAGFNATAGGVSLNDVTAGVANLTATSNVNATVSTTDRVNATSSGSYVQLTGEFGTPLRLGTINGSTGIYLYSSSGMEQAAGGLLTSRYVNLYPSNSMTPTGSLAAPILVAAPSAGVEPELTLYGLAAPAHVALVGGPNLGRLSLGGTVSGLSGTTLTGAANLSTFTLGQSAGVLTLSAVSSAGLAGGLSVNVDNGALDATSLTLPGAPVSLSASGAVTVGTMTGASLDINAQGAVNITSASTTGSNGISVSNQVCNYYDYVACAASSPIIAGTLNAGGTGSVDLYTFDNGNISVTNLSAGRDIELQTGQVYPTTPGFPYTTQPTSNNIVLGTVVAGRNFNAQNSGAGNIDVTSLAASGSVYVQAGSSYSPSYNTYLDTANVITIGNNEPGGTTGGFSVTNQGVGNVTLTGAINRPAGGVNLYAAQGSVVATGGITTSSSVDVTANGGGATLGQVAAGSGGGNGNVNVQAGTDVLFDSISATAVSSFSGNVTLAAGSGFVRTALDNTGFDVIGTGNVTVTAGTSIGNAGFANPLDLRAGTGKSVTLQAGTDIGAAGKPIWVDTDGTLDVATVAGQFHVAATDGSTERSLSAIRLSASAAGVGNGNSATFTSADLDVAAASNGTTLTIGDLIRSTGNLNEFRFAATGSSGLTFGDVDFTTAGFNQLVLNSTGTLMQSNGNINAGYVRLDSGGNAITAGNITSSTAGPNSVGNLIEISGGDITTGNLNALSMNISGANLSLGSVTTTGTHRNYDSNYLYVPRLDDYQYVNDDMYLTASGTLSTSGNIASATSATVSAGAGVSVNGGAGTIDGGHYQGYYDNDVVQVNAGTGALASGAIAARYVTLMGDSLNTGAVTADNNLSLTASSFNTGNLTATGGNITINASGAYVPGSIGHTAASNVSITAPQGIDLVTNNASLTAPSVSLHADAGDVLANLTGTSNLTLVSGGMFTVNSNVALTNLNVTASGTVAGFGAGSAVTANGGAQSLTYVATGSQLDLLLESNSGMSYTYNELDSGVTDVVINTTGTFGGTGGSVVSVSAPSASITANSVLLANGTLQLNAGGDLWLNSVSTGGGSVAAYTSGSTGAGTLTLTSVVTGGGNLSAQTSGDSSRHVLVERVLTTGGSVTLTADNGNIERTGAQLLQIDTRNGQGLASGSTTLSAANGSVGSAGSRLQTSGAVSMDVTARDEIAVDVLNTALTNLSLTTSASGNGAISVSDTNFATLGVSRNGTSVTLAALSPVTAGAFALTTTDGDLMVAGDISNVAELRLNAGYGINGTGNLLIQANGGPRTVSADSYDLRAGQDVVIAAGALAGEDVTVTQASNAGYNYVFAGRDITVAGNGGTALLEHNAAGWTQTLSAGRDLRVTGGSAGIVGASALVTATGFQTLTAGNLLLVQAGSSDGGSASVLATQSQNSGTTANISVLGGGDNAFARLSGQSQSFTNVSGTVLVQGGSGSGALAEFLASGGSQSVGSTSVGTDLIQVQGGTGAGALASLRASTSQSVQSSGDIRVIGGAGAGADAELRAGSSQTVGNTSTYFNDPTAAILVQAGAGGKAQILAGSTQTVMAGDTISVIAGANAGMSASIESSGGSQSIGSSGTSLNDATGNILIQAGAGNAAFASFKASGTQTINTGGTIQVLGGSGAGANAEILSTVGGQTIGSTSTNFNDATDSITVQAGAGGIARIQSQTNQTIRTGGDLSVLGGSGANMTAAVQSIGGFQTIGNTSPFSNDPSGAILVQAGTGAGAAAFINAATGQTIDAGGTIALLGNAAGAYAEMVSTAGPQTIGNVGGSNDRTDTISLTGGSGAGAYARMTTSGSQSIRTGANLTLAGGAGDNAGAQMVAGTGQNFTVQGALSMTGGSGSAPGLNETAIRNNTSGSQSLSVTGNMAITGGGFGSDTWVKQNGSGTQVLSVGGTLALLSPAATTSTGVTSIEALGPSQQITVGGAMTVDNQAGWLTYVSATGTQTLTADSLGISVSSTATSGPFAGVTATGNQAITLNGDGVTVGTATLSIFNTSPMANSSAAVSTAANQTILMDYDSAGLVQIGSTAGMGRAQIFAGGTHTMVAGQLLIQGGASADADAAIVVPNAAAVISTIYGPIELKGGALGSATIDPPQLDMVSNSGVLLLAGPGTGADAIITAGIFNLAATSGDLTLTQTPAAVAAINADTFNYYGAGNVALNGGTITVTTAGTITIGGICYNCTTNLFGPFSVTAYVPPPTDFGALVTADVLALADLGIGLFDAFYDEDGELVLTNRRLNQCY